MKQLLRPQTVDRLFLHLHRAGLPGQIYWCLSIDGRLDREAMVDALVATIREQPRLSSVLRTGVLRYARRTHSWSRDELGRSVIEGSWGETELPLPERCDLHSEPSVRVAFTADQNTARLWVAIHHSVTDAFGALRVVDRLGQHYRASTGGTRAAEAESPAASHGYGHFYRKLPRAQQWQVAKRVLAQWTDTLSSGAYQTGSEPCATFADLAVHRGFAPVCYRVHRVSWEQAGRLLRFAVRRRATLTDLLLTLTVRAGCEVWPEQAGKPVHASVPLSARDSNALGNPVLPNNVIVPWSREQSLSKVLASVVEQSGRVRGIDSGLVQAAERTMLSLLPPALASRLILRAFDHDENTRETLTFTSLGQLEACITEFGDFPVRDAYCVGSLLAPPGLKVAVVPSPAGLNLVVHWLEGVTAEAKIDSLIACLKREVESVLTKQVA